MGGFMRNLGLCDNDEMLFFILIFLLLFNGDCLGGIFGKKDCHGDNDGDSTILFFIILFLLLFTNEDRAVVRAD